MDKTKTQDKHVVATIPFHIEFLTMEAPDGDTDTPIGDRRAYVSEKGSKLVWENKTAWKNRAEALIQAAVGRRYSIALKAHIEQLHFGSLTGVIVLTFAFGMTLKKLRDQFTDFDESLGQLSPEFSNLLTRASQELFVALGMREPILVDANVLTPTLVNPTSVYRLAAPAGPTKTLLRLLVLALGLSYVLLQFQFGKNILAYFWPVAELQHQVILLRGSNGNMENQAYVEIANNGYGPARNVYVQLAAHGARIVNLQSSSEEQFEQLASVDPQGEVRWHLERLAPETRLSIWLESDTALQAESLAVSAIGENGSSHLTGVTEFAGDRQQWETRRSENAPFAAIQSFYQDQIASLLPGLPGGDLIKTGLENPTIQVALLALGVLVFFVWLYAPSPDTWAFLVGVWGLWLIHFRLFDLPVRASWILLTAVACAWLLAQMFWGLEKLSSVQLWIKISTQRPGENPQDMLTRYQRWRLFIGAALFLAAYLVISGFYFLWDVYAGSAWATLCIPVTLSLAVWQVANQD